jgi:hypothetical protein
MKSFCKCGERVSDKAEAEANRLDADYPRCEGCLEIWKESPVNRAKVGGKGVSRTNITEELVEQFAFEGLSKREAAERFGITLNGFNGALYGGNRPWVKAAWKRGELRRLNGEAQPEEIQQNAIQQSEEKPEITTAFRTNDALTQCFYLLLRDYLPAGRLHKVIEAVRAADGKGKVLSNFYLASLAEEYAGIIQKTK